MHGAANIATPIVLPGVDRPTWLILGGVIYALVAVAFIVAHRRGARNASVEVVAPARP
jgi:hypothetical protein